jgi:hypothetical protein
MQIKTYASFCSSLNFLKNLGIHDAICRKDYCITGLAKRRMEKLLIRQFKCDVTIPRFCF